MRRHTQNEHAASEQGKEDAILIKLIAQQNAEAFNQFCRNHFSSLHHFLAKIIRNLDTVEEVINDAFFVVWQKAGQFKFQSAPKTWLFGIAYNKALKTIEKSARAPQTDELDEQHIASNACPESVSTHQQTSAQIQGALHALSPEHRAVMELTFYHGYSYSEIGEIIGCPANTVKTRMFHARKLLKGHLSAQNSKGEI